MGTTTTADVVVIGDGVIGAAVAWRCAQQELSVVVVDPDPARGAWNTAAGMLAPVTELHYAESPLLRLNLESLRRYTGFVEELADVTGMPSGFRESGTVSVAWDAADLAALRDLHTFGRTLGLDAQLVSGKELRELEPSLAPGLPGGLLALDDHQVDPRVLHAALVEAGHRCGVRRIAARARLDISLDRATGVVLSTGGHVDAGIVVLAAGAWSSQSGVPASLMTLVRPVKGSTLRLRLPGEPVLRHVVRATVKGSPVYLVPRADGQIIVGASTEEVGFDVTPRAGAVYELLRDAQSVLPELGEAVLDEVNTGLRPGSPDNAPLIGASGLDGLVLATGHYRNGILLAPVTADAVAELLVGGTLPALLEPFAPSRFRPAVPA